MEANQKLKDLISIYERSVDRFSQCGSYINSKEIEKNGLHLLNLANEMQSIELEIEKYYIKGEK